MSLLEEDTSLPVQTASKAVFCFEGRHCIFQGCLPRKNRLEQRVVSDLKWRSMSHFIRWAEMWETTPGEYLSTGSKNSSFFTNLDILLGAVSILIAQYTMPVSQHPSLGKHILILLGCGYDYHMNHKWWYDRLTTLKQEQLLFSSIIYNYSWKIVWEDSFYTGVSLNYT